MAPTRDAIVFNNHLDNADLNYAFGGSQDLQVQAMTAQEMDEMQGAVLPFVAATLMGGVVSAWINHGTSYSQTGHLASTKSTVIATGAGMVEGAYTTSMLRGAGITTSIFNKSAWSGKTGVENGIIRVNGDMVGEGTVGVWDRSK